MISLRTTDLFQEILVNPYSSGKANELLVVSGYASPKMLAQHLQAINQVGRENKFTLRLIIGMAGGANFSPAATAAFIGLMLDNTRFSSQVFAPRSRVNVHSKLYVWIKAEQPVEAWIGSANYSRLAFGLTSESDYRDEVMVKADPEKSLNYALDILNDSDLLRDEIPRANSTLTQEIEVIRESSGFVLPETMDSSRYAICPLVNSRTKEVHNPGAGLNWGQPSDGRSRADTEAAYIPVPSRFREFFPPTGELFETQCADGQVLILARGQQGGKALATPSSNSILGRYFRLILGVGPGEPVTTQDLERFGSDCVVFEKSREGNFSLHFYPGLKLDNLMQRLD